MLAFQPTGKGNKVVRANTALATAAAGNAVLPDVVRNPETAAWVRQWLEQVVSFPAGANDDDVDAWSQLEHHWLEQEQGQSMADLAQSFGFM
jgi:predicted phage terminase large subunit-like protein